ncbi:MAG: hypothetical protein UHD05_02480 [Ruminococcus sp.]|nr:hypothetical protein [Ruminococcus sp.]
MSEKDKEQELLRELEIQSILEETHYLADQEKMEKTAQKYRAKPKMDEIFSNTSKKPRLTNESPLDVDKAIEAEIVADTTNTIVGEKTATTMQAALMMDGSPEDVKTPEEAQAEAEKKAEEERRKAEAEAEENKIVTLTPEYDENTNFSGEVLGEVESFKEETSKIESIHTIDIELGEDKPEESKAVPKS